MPGVRQSFPFEAGIGAIGATISRAVRGKTFLLRGVDDRDDGRRRGQGRRHLRGLEWNRQGGTVGETGFGVHNFGPGDIERAFPLWDKDNWFAGVAGFKPLDVKWVADALLYVVTRPRDMMVKVIHARSSR
jgi:hypothetical protein